MVSFIEKFDNCMKGSLAFLDNKYLHAILAIFLVTYANKAAPELPKIIMDLLDNIFVKFIIFFLIAYITGSGVITGIIAALIALILIQFLTLYKDSEKMENVEIPKVVVVDKKQKNEKPNIVTIYDDCQSSDSYDQLVDNIHNNTLPIELVDAEKIQNEYSLGN